MDIGDILRGIDTERLLIWTYRDQRADVVIGHGMGLYNQQAELDGRTHYATSTDGISAIQRIGLLGTLVDGGGPSASHRHVDVEIVHETVGKLSYPIAHLIMTHARAASRPADAAIPLPRPVQVPNRLGRPTVRYAEWDRGRDDGWCVVGGTVSAASADTLRKKYALWRAAEVRLAATLTTIAARAFPGAMAKRLNESMDGARR